MTDESIARGESLIIKRRIEQRPGEIGAERAAALNRPHRPAAPCATADRIHDLAKGQPESGLVKAAVADVAGDLDRHCPARTPEPEPGIKIGAAIKDRRHRHERQDIVDDGWAAEEPFMRRQRRFGAHDSALAFQAFEQGSLFAADIGASPHPQFNLEGMPRT